MGTENNEEFDKEGAPRKTYIMPDGTTFHGSEKEYMAANAEEGREQK